MHHDSSHGLPWDRNIPKEEVVNLAEPPQRGSGDFQRYHMFADSAGRNSIQCLQHDAAWYQQECRNTLLDSIKSAAETNEISQVAAEKLNGQSEQLERIQSDVQRISHTLDTSQYLMQGLKSWWGSVMQVFTPAPQPPTSSGISTRDKPQVAKSAPFDARIAGPMDTSHNKKLNTVRTNNNPRGLHHNRITEFDSEIDKNLDVLSDMLSDIQSRAVEVGTTLEYQNQMLTDIQTGVDRNAHKMAKQQKDLNNLLKRR